MTDRAEELLPVLTVSLFDRSEIEGLVMSALDGSVALVPIADAFVMPGTYVLELCSPDRARPLTLAGEMAGEPSGGMCPMVLKPIDGANAEELLDFLGRVSLPPEKLEEAMAKSSGRIEVRILTPRHPDAATTPLELPELTRSRPSTTPMQVSSEESPRTPAQRARDAGTEGTTGHITWQSLSSPDVTSQGTPVIDVIGSTDPSPPRPREELRNAVTLDNQDAPIDSSARPSVTNDPLLGRSLGGKYVISTLIGAGGAGSVYRARHVMLQKDIAIKVMHPSLRKDPTFAQRFHSEALAASKLDHPNVLRVLDFGEEPDGLLYIAMELLVGTELRALLWQGRMPLARSLDIVCQICAALSAASEVGIVHRDIKPENVVITSSRDDEGDTVDLVKVCDFGLATIAKSEAAGSGEHRAASYIAGTPEYMSPEQVRGEELDGRSDIYAVGVLLYELLTGRLPFEAEAAVDILKAHLHRAVTPPSELAEVDPEVEALVLRSLAKDRHQRPSTARELRAELRGVLERLRRPPTVAQPPEPTAIPLDDPAAGFGELFVALTAAVARTTYYEREHPEFARSLVRLVHATRSPLAGRTEITLAQRDVRDLELVVQTGIGEVLDLRRVVAGGVAEAYGPRLAEVFQRRHVVSLTLKEGISEADLADATELLSGPEVGADVLRLDFLSRGLSGVSILFSEEMLGKSRKLPWHVDLCISRLARDLRALPLLRGVTEEAMRSLRVQLVADVVRNLERPDDIRLLLENTDLVANSVQHVPELGTLDLRGVIVAALRRPLAVAAARTMLAAASRSSLPPVAPERGASDGRSLGAPSAPASSHASARALLGVMASRFLRERSPESDDLLRAMLRVNVLDLSELPSELQLAIEAERLAAAMADDHDLIFRKLAAAPDMVTFHDEIASIERALAVLAKSGDARSVAHAVTGLKALACGASPGDTSREELAASAVSSLGDETALAALADALLFGAVAQREPARTVLGLLGAAAARALLAARVRAAAPDASPDAWMSGSASHSPTPVPFPRPRFVAALREIGRAALPALAEHLSRIDPEGEESSSDGGATLAEDLLRALPDVPDESLGRAVARFLRHRAPPVRRAAAAGLPGLLGPRAKPSLMHALDDVDEGVRAAAFAGLRSIRGVDESVVSRVDHVLNGGAPASDELRAGAAGALAEVSNSARASAVAVLTKALRPKGRSMLSIFKNDAEGDGVLVTVTVARVLLAIGGPEDRKEVERRAGSSRGELKKALVGLLNLRA